MTLRLREWQQEKLNESLEVIKNGKTLILSANPGAGKTIFALLLARMLNKKAVFFVRTHSEFESVYKNAKMLGMSVGFLFGKSSSCVYAEGNEDPEDINCDLCPLKEKIKVIEDKEPTKILSEIKHAEDYCPYYSMKSSLKDKEVIVLTYPYLFSKHIRNSLFMKKDGLTPSEYLAVVDEAHNILEADKWFMKRITKKTVERAMEEVDVVGSLGKTSVNDIKDYLNSLLNFMEQLVSDGKCHSLPIIPRPNPELLRKINMVTATYVNLNKGPVNKSSLRALSKFLNESGEVFNCNGSLVVIPNTYYEEMNDALNLFKYKVLMSGTMPQISLPNSHRIDVNVSLGKAEYYYCSSVSSSMRNRSSSAGVYAEVLSKIYSLSSSNVLVFFPSYAMLSLVKEKIKRIPIIEEGKKITHSEMIELMKGGKYLVFLVTRAKESEGIEFRDEKNKNLFDSLVLAGLPYPNVSDDIVNRRIERLARSWGVNEEEVAKQFTLITIKQTIGRAFRDPNDYVKVYLCDSRYKEYFSDLGVSEKEIKLFV
uniref:helicase C-terminal domain-containing protein n=1 Tax=Sulfolobus sp. NOB8H2 TaxID=84600 RepID=UPI00000624BC|nr:helicase C-terminal domain-containing protein [Sulfolobus sp. NOB8H2]CAA09115.1 hypothetical protein [Sulfolobus sp. NOB8H2]